jgi:hypothetical protein
MKATKPLLTLLLIAVVVILITECAFGGRAKLPNRPKEVIPPEIATYGGGVFLIWGLGIALHWLLLASFPNRTERLTTLYQRSPWKSFFMGLINMIIIGFILAVTLQHAHPLGVLLSFITAIILFVGIHGRSRSLGRKILKASKHEPNAFAEATVGWTAAVFLWAIPYLGWYIIGTYLFAGGLGAVTLSFFSKPTPKGGVDLDSHEL